MANNDNRGDPALTYTGDMVCYASCIPWFMGTCTQHDIGACASMYACTLCMQDEAWRKEAVVLWSYVDRLAAALDISSLHPRGTPGPPRPITAAATVSARPGTGASTPARGGGATHGLAGRLVVSSEVSRDPAWEGGRRVPAPRPRLGCGACRTRPPSGATHDSAAPCGGGTGAAAGGSRGAGPPRPSPDARGSLPAPLDARGLGQVLRSVRAVESYLVCTRRMLHCPGPPVGGDAVDDESGASPRVGEVHISHEMQAHAGLVS